MLYVLPTLDIGGTERRVVRLVQGLDRSRYEPLLCCIKRLGPLADDVRAAGVEPILLPFRGRWDPQGIFGLIRLVRTERPAIVHSWLFRGNIFGRVGGFLGGAPILLASEAGEYANVPTLQRRLTAIVDRLLAPLSERILVNSESVADYVRGEHISNEKIVVIPNGVPIPREDVDRERLRRELGHMDGRALVGMIARLSFDKDHRTFLEAAAITVDKRADVHFVIVGDGPQRQPLERLADEMHLGNSVSFVGQRSDGPHLPAALDISVLCTHSEGMSNVLLESMAWGAPIVATDISPNRELLKHGVDALLVPPQDPVAVAASIMQLLDDPALAQSLGSAARLRAEVDFSVGAQAERMMTLYDRLLAERGYALLQRS